MSIRTLAAAAALFLPVAAFAQDAAPADPAAVTGDAAAGEQQFNRQCVACHVVANEAGEVLAGRNAQTGPNLYHVAGRVPGSEDFDYSDAMIAYGETGAIWTEENTVPYLLDPTGYLREALDDPSARSKMAYKVRDEQQARDIYAYLASFGVAEGAGGAEGGDAAAAEGGDAAAAPAEGGDAAAPAEGEAAPAEGEASGG